MRKEFLGRVLCAVLFLILLTGCGSEEKPASFTVSDLQVNHQINPLAIDDNISFSWKMVSKESNQYQSSYRITLAESKKNLEKKKYIWDSGDVNSSESVNVPYSGETLMPGKKYYWQVLVRNSDSEESISEENAFFGVGLDEEGWADAKWISLQHEQRKAESATSYTIQYDFKTDIQCDSGVVFGADNMQYGKYIICSVETTDALSDIVVREMNHEDTVYETRYSLAEYYNSESSIGKNCYNFKINVSKKNLEILCNDSKVASHQLSDEYGLGAVGVWTGRGETYAFYDNIQVTTNDGTIVYSDIFDNEDTIFSPYYAKIVDGWLEASSGYLFTTGSEIAAPMLRKEFESNGDIESATLYASAYGIYNMYLNGEKISDEYFSPGHSQYQKEVYYRAYDITSKINEGRNAIGIMLGSGRYNKAGNNFGDTLATKIRLVITYENGTQDILVSDESWMGYDNGPVRNEDMFIGEYYDSNYEVEGWSKPFFEATDWKNVDVYEGTDARLVATDTYPVRCVEKITPVSVTEPKPGTYVYDMGQNITGFCRINVEGQKGQSVVLRYAEWLNEENLIDKDDVVGSIYTRNLFTAKNTDIYVLNGNGVETYEPYFVCRGFRYVQITGIDNPLPVEAVTGMALTTDNKRTGSFECSDENMNKLYEAIYWSQIDNYMDFPTDCPQRDERYGWAGDAQAFAPTSTYNSDVYQFLRQYVTTLRLGQSESGWYPEIGGRVYASGGSNGWSDAGVTIPWTLYTKYGDKEIIYENFDAMCKYVDYLVSTSENYLREHKGYADYNSYNSLPDNISNTAQCAYVSKLLANMCEAIGENEAADKYREVYNKYKDSWQQFISESGAVADWQQSGMTMGLAFELYPDELKAAGAKCLDTTVAFSDYHVSTGYIATPFLLPVLSDNGYSETAYKLIQQTTFPSWNYMINHGATTLTEGWNTFDDKEDGSYKIRGSLNHYAYGSVGSWLYEYVLGIKPDEGEPGFKHFYLRPMAGGGLGYAKGSYESVYGTIVSEWRVEGQEIVYHFSVPANTSATLSLPDERYQGIELLSGEYEYRINLQ